MGKYPQLENWEKRLDAALVHIDKQLESVYGGRYSLHPSRPPSGSTANPKYDGLFSVEAKFSAGFGSEHGRGYVLSIRMATLTNVPAAVVKQIQDEAAELLRKKLPEVFPNRELRVERDGSVYKIVGDLSLKSA